ncbi:Carboxypeptidase A2 [Hypsibius exemplaris]|uniref:Carboxypeptidase A2 n=1 Tax=Hypsibius exemplaris TaxID=2072580 RepID=A0A9X6NF07_HYPEX|nr:Carboxypeptidase A2 [Hypsibius exemplaris]
MDLRVFLAGSNGFAAHLLSFMLLGMAGLGVAAAGNGIYPAAFTIPSRNDYANHQLFKVYVHKVDELNLLKQWRTDHRHLNLDFWDDSLPTNFNVKRSEFLIRVLPPSVDEFTALLLSAELDFQILSHDLKRLIQWEKLSVADARNQRGMVLSIPGIYQSYRRVLLPGVQTLSSYLPLESIYDSMDSIALRYPFLISSFELGRTFEGRPIKGLKIGTPFVNFKDSTFDLAQENPAPVKSAILLDGAMQGREWITVPALMYLTQQLVAKYDIDEDARFLLDFYDWYIIPVMNPDGYHFSWTTDRFWKKTRSISILNSTLNNPQCRGVDLNRNFAYKWGESDDPESGIFDVCQRAFAGDKPFSERESTALAKFMYNNRKHIKVYATLQNYGQTVLMPYASKTTPAKDSRDHILAANVATRAMHKLYGEEYDLGTFSESLFATGGTTIDWAYEVAHIKHSYQFQLRDKGNWGYLLPRSQIIPAAAEFYTGITELVRFVHFYEQQVDI